MPKGQKFTSDKPTAQEILRLKKPNEKEVEILLNPVHKEGIKLKEDEVERLTRLERSGRKDLSQKAAAQAQDELDALLDAARADSVTFLFRDIGKKKLDNLIAAHPPTDEQKQLWKDEGNPGVLGYNLETFPAALIAACAVDPVLTEEEAQVICDEWGGGDIEALFYGALAACRERTSIPLSRRGTAAMSDSPLNSTTALNGESPTPDS